MKNKNKHNSVVKDFFINVKKIIRMFTQYKKSLFLALLLTLLSTAFSIFGPKVVAKAIDELFDGLKNIISSDGMINFEKLISLLLIALAIYLAATVFQILQSIVAVNISRNACYDLRKKLISKVNTLEISYFESNSKGNIISRVSNDVDTLAQNLSNIFTNTIVSITMLIGSFIMMLSLNVKLTIIVLIIVPISLALMYFVIKYSQQNFINQQNKLGEINGLAEEYFNAQALVQLYGKKEETINKFNKANDDLFKESFRANIITRISSPIFSLINNFSYIAIVIFGAFEIMAGQFTVGGILAFNQYVNNFTNPLNYLLNLSGTVQQMAAACKRIEDFLSAPDEQDLIIEKKENEISKYKAIPNNSKYIIEFDHVAFSYVKGKEVIRDFSLKIKKGQTIAIVGPTGAGKTTLIKLLLKYYKIDKGSIKLNGIDINSALNNDVRDYFCSVMQNIWLFSGTIKENIKYGNDNATFEDIKNTAKLSRAHQFINKLPGTYDFEINEGAGNFSQGEKQLLSISRAIAAKRDILILDEATSSVDSATEEKLYKAFDTVIEEKTAIVIAHRLSTIKNADIILVLNNGDIIEQGNHKTLLEKKGFYYELWQSATS